MPRTNFFKISDIYMQNISQIDASDLFELLPFY